MTDEQHTNNEEPLFGVSFQLFLQVLIMIFSLSIASVVFFYTFKMDRWRGPWTQEVYYRLGDHDRPVEMPSFLKRHPRLQIVGDIKDQEIEQQVREADLDQATESQPHLENATDIAQSTQIEEE